MAANGSRPVPLGSAPAGRRVQSAFGEFHRKEHGLIDAFGWRFQIAEDMKKPLGPQRPPARRLLAGAYVVAPERVVIAQVEPAAT